MNRSNIPGVVGRALAWVGAGGRGGPGWAATPTVGCEGDRSSALTQDIPWPIPGGSCSFDSTPSLRSFIQYIASEIDVVFG